MVTVSLLKLQMSLHFLGFYMESYRMYSFFHLASCIEHHVFELIHGIACYFFISFLLLVVV